MSADIIDGKAFAANLRARVSALVPGFRTATGRAPGLAVVLVGEDPASQVYVRSKHKATIEAGMESFEHRLSAETSQDDLLAMVERPITTASSPLRSPSRSLSSIRQPSGVQGT